MPKLAEFEQVSFTHLLCVLAVSLCSTLNSNCHEGLGPLLFDTNIEQKYDYGQK